MKSKEVPPALVWGGLALIILIIVGVSYSMFFKPPAQTDPTTISAERLRDPDPPRTARP